MNNSTVYDGGGESKAVARALAAPSSVRSNVIMLPAARCLCVKQFLEMGMFDSQTRLTVVERDPFVADIVDETIGKMGFSHYSLLRGALHRLEPQHEIDYAFIDLMGMPDRNLAIWARDHLFPALAIGADVVFTLNTGVRGSQFVKRLQELAFSKEGYPVLTSIARELGCGHAVIVQYVLLLKWLADGYSFSIDTIYDYVDKTNPMVLIALRDVQPSEKSFPLDLEEVLEVRKREYFSVPTQEVRTMAAAKGTAPIAAGDVIDRALTAKTAGEHAHATRLLNAYVKQRVAAGFSEKGVRAAIKAHVTRRAMY